jgi:hypothetical protein
LHILFAFGIRPPGTSFRAYSDEGSRPLDTEYYLLTGLLNNIDGTCARNPTQVNVLMDALIVYAREAIIQREGPHIAEILLGHQARPGHLRLALLVELGRLDMFEEVWKEMGRPSLAAHVSELPLLFHSVARPILAKLTQFVPHFNLTNDFSQYLLNKGCDPDEPFDLCSDGNTATVWETIVRFSLQDWYQGEQNLEEILPRFQCFLERGADVCVARDILFCFQPDGCSTEELGSSENETDDEDEDWKNGDDEQDDETSEWQRLFDLLADFDTEADNQETGIEGIRVISCAASPLITNASVEEPAELIQLAP